MYACCSRGYSLAARLISDCQIGWYIVQYPGSKSRAWDEELAAICLIPDNLPMRSEPLHQRMAQINDVSPVNLWNRHSAALLPTAAAATIRQEDAKAAKEQKDIDPLDPRRKRRVSKLSSSNESATLNSLAPVFTLKPKNSPRAGRRSLGGAFNLPE